MIITLFLITSLFNITRHHTTVSLTIQEELISRFANTLYHRDPPLAEFYFFEFSHILFAHRAYCFHAYCDSTGFDCS